MNSRNFNAHPNGRFTFRSVSCFQAALDKFTLGKHTKTWQAGCSSAKSTFTLSDLIAVCSMYYVHSTPHMFCVYLFLFQSFFVRFHRCDRCVMCLSILMQIYMVV